MIGPKNKTGFLTLQIFPMHDGQNLSLLLVESHVDGTSERDEFISMRLSPSQARMFADMLKSASECEDDEPSVGMTNIAFETPE